MFHYLIVSALARLLTKYEFYVNVCVRIRNAFQDQPIFLFELNLSAHGLKFDINYVDRGSPQQAKLSLDGCGRRLPGQSTAPPRCPTKVKWYQAEPTERIGD